MPFIMRTGLITTTLALITMPLLLSEVMIRELMFGMLTMKKEYHYMENQEIYTATQLE